MSADNLGRTKFLRNHFHQSATAAATHAPANFSASKTEPNTVWTSTARLHSIALLFSAAGTWSRGALTKGVRATLRSSPVGMIKTICSDR